MRARNIKPGFFLNDQLGECSIAARLAFIGLWAVADREGRLVYRPKRLRAEIFPYDDVDMAQLVGELERNELVVIYEVEGVQYLWIPNFRKHQTVHPNEQESVLPPCPTGSPKIDHEANSANPGNTRVDQNIAKDNQGNTREIPTVNQGNTRVDQRTDKVHPNPSGISESLNHESPDLNTPPLPPARGTPPPYGRSAPDGGAAPASGGECGISPDGLLLPRKEPTPPEAKNSPPRRNRSSGNTIPELRAAISAFTEDEKLRDALEEFRKMREQLRKPLTGRALELAFAQLEKLAPHDIPTQIALVNQSILRSWLCFFPLQVEQARGRTLHLSGDSPQAPGDMTLTQRNKATADRVMARLQQEGLGNAV